MRIKSAIDVELMASSLVRLTLDQLVLVRIQVRQPQKIPANTSLDEA